MAKKKVKKKAARKVPTLQHTKYNLGVGAKIIKLAQDGMTDKQIANELGFTETTLNNWKGSFPDLFKSLKEAKNIPDELVEISLFARAMGYSHPEEKIFCNQYGDVTKVDTVKHYAPDTTACIFWLKNRQPAKWRDKQEIDHNVFPKPMVIEYSDGTRTVLGHDGEEKKDKDK